MDNIQPSALNKLPVLDMVSSQPPLSLQGVTRSSDPYGGFPTTPHTSPIPEVTVPIVTKVKERTNAFINQMFVFCAGSCGKRGYYCNFSKCGKCKIMPYCSKECQRRDWPAHKIVCDPFH